MEKAWEVFEKVIEVGMMLLGVGLTIAFMILEGMRFAEAGMWILLAVAVIFSAILALLALSVIKFILHP